MEDRNQQLEAMRMGVDYSYPARVRGLTIMLRPLTIAEYLEMAHTIVLEMSKMPEHMRTAVMEDTIKAKETIKRASQTSSTKYDPQIFDATLNNMTSDELLAFYKQYLECMDKVNPMLELLPPEEMENLVASLKKKREDLASQLIQLSFSERVSLLHHLLTKGD